jgi:Biotin-lipoyl like/HlyD family secretion protein
MSQSAHSTTQQQASPQANIHAPSREQAFIQLMSRAMSAAKPADLQFIIVNETLQLAHYRQAAFFDSSLHKKPILTTASGLVSVAENSPYSVWLNRFAKTFSNSAGGQRINFADAKPEHADGWQEWLPEHLLVFPLFHSGQLYGHAMYAREQAWTDNELAQLDYLHNSYSYCLAALHKKNYSFTRTIFSWLNLKTLAISGLLLAALMLVPVRLSSLAPAEVIALNAFSVAAPQEGVVHAFTVEPNSNVKTGDLLFTLDDTSIMNRFEVASKALATAKADALVAEQRAFDDIKGKAELAGAIGRMREKEAELASIKALMARVEIRAERDGIAIFSDANDWIGRPVQTGERVMQIANPADAGLLMWLPVKDALNINTGAPMKLFLHTDPLHPIEAKLQQTSYQASMSPENVSSYRLKGAFNQTDKLPRIGLRGTARISGEWSVLGYYLFRRPISATRAWLGL